MLSSRILAALAVAAVLYPASAQTAAPKTRTVRDPFVNQIDAKSTVVPQPPRANNHPLTHRPDAPGNTRVFAETVPAPSVAVQGVILSTSGNQAIVTSPTRTYMIRPGDKLGDYKVSAIEAHKVIFSFKDKNFAIALQNEFTAMAGGHAKRK